jgi:hypothetical protein
MSERPGDDFERWLERELRQVVVPIRGSRPRAEQAAYRAAGARRSPASLAVRSAVAVAAVGVAVIGGLSGAAAMTGSPDPMSLGRLVVHAVRAEPQGAPAMPGVQGQQVDAQAVTPRQGGPTSSPSPTESRRPSEPGTTGGSEKAPVQDGSADQDQQDADGNVKHADHSPKPAPPPPATTPPSPPAPPSPPPTPPIPGHQRG